MAVCYSGDPAGADDALAPIRALPDPVVDLISEQPYTEVQSYLDDSEPKGHHYYWKTEFVPELSDDFLPVFVDIGSAIESPMSQMMMFHLEGAVNEHAEDDGAVGNRDATYVTGAAGAWPAMRRLRSSSRRAPNRSGRPARPVTRPPNGSPRWPAAPGRSPPIPTPPRSAGSAD